MDRRIFLRYLASTSAAAVPVFLAGANAFARKYPHGTSTTTTTTSTTTTLAPTTTTTLPTTTTTTLPTGISCLQETNNTRGPYFLDEQNDPYIYLDTVNPNIPQRSDVRPYVTGSSTLSQGLPLDLKIIVGSYLGNGSCSPVANAQVHIWHCDAQGVYSGVQAPDNGNGTDYRSVYFLRGYQFTNGSGEVNFRTIYPGWYPGRAVHIHVKVRCFDAFGRVISEATTQLFFNETVTSAVYASNPNLYKTGSGRTMNTGDSIFLDEHPSLFVNLTGSATTGYSGTASIGIQLGSIYGG